MSRPICKEQGCEKEINGRGLCKSHYMEWYRQTKAANNNAYLSDYKEPVKSVPGGYLGRTREWTEEDLEMFWIWVKEELKLV